jgi:oxazoline/thiazoline synthase
MKQPQLKPHFRLEVIEPKQVYLLSENATHALTGTLYCQILPLLTGQHTRTELIEKLDGQVVAEHLDYVLDRLQEKSYLTDAAPALTPAAAAFWSGLGVEPSIVAEKLSQQPVTIATIGSIDPQPLIAALQAIGITAQVAKPLEISGGLQIILTDDYLQPELQQINHQALENHQPWLLAKPSGSILWLGPIFQPGSTGCWACLAQRLRGNREVETSVLRQQGNRTGCLPVSIAALPSTMQSAIGLIATETAKWLIQQAVPNSPIQTLAGKLFTLDQGNLALSTHALPHRPQCAACGNPETISTQLNEPLTLVSRKKLFTQDGGHRAFTPEQILHRYAHLISPITGVVTSLDRISDPNNPLVHTYSAIHAFGAAANLTTLRKSLRHKSGGKGKTDQQSQASGFCEAVERYSGIYQGDEPRISSTLAALGEQAIHPAHCLLFSETQYQNRIALNEQSIVAHDWIPLPFDETQTIDWTPVWSLTHQTQKYLPTVACYYNYSLPKDHRFYQADSNGNAAGGTLEDAILQGFLELVERDAVALWWYNRLARPEVDLASFDEPYLLDLQAWYQTLRREMWVLDITTDLNIPTFAAVSRYIGADTDKEYILAGYGSHFDPKIAILRAVTELNQMSNSLPEKHPLSPVTSELSFWFDQANIASQPYLWPDPVPAKLASDYITQWSDDIHQDVLHCVAILQQVGLEMLVLDQTRPDIGLPVVKVIVPGLRHFWSRFGAGRLYEVPVKLGWLPEPLSEDEMNPMPMVF